MFDMLFQISALLYFLCTYVIFNITCDVFQLGNVMVGYLEKVASYQIKLLNNSLQMQMLK